MNNKIDERLEVMGVNTSGMTDEQKFTAATGLTRYSEYEANNPWYVPGGAANVKSEETGEQGATDQSQPTGEQGATDQSQPTGEQGQTYTAEEAAAYNLTLDGALQYGAIKTPAVEAVEAQDAVLYENADEYNTAKGTKLTEEQFNELTEEEKIKTPAVTAVEGHDAVLYTNEEVDTHNAALPGAKKAGDPKTSSAEVVTES